MHLIDRHILARFGVNFLILFVLLYVFAVSIDLILNLDKFVDVARSSAGEGAGGWLVAWQLVGAVADFEGPRVFQFYAYLHGLVSIGAMGFTLAQMHRHRELVAVMASGTSLHRVAMPFVIAVFALSLLQLVNQELILPRVAPMLLREQDEIGERAADSFEVVFTADGRDHLLQAPKFTPSQEMLTSPTILELDARGRTQRRITAARATWSEERGAWQLQGGRSISASPPTDLDDAATVDRAMRTEDVREWPTDLSPRALMVRRHNQYATMLSLEQINQMLETGRVAKRERDKLLRYSYSRFSSVLVNLLVLLLTLPCFLLREPANLLRQSVLAASLAIPATMGSAIGMMVDLPGIPPALGVFVPVIALGFMALFPWTFFKT